MPVIQNYKSLMLNQTAPESDIITMLLGVRQEHSDSFISMKVTVGRGGGGAM